MGTDKRPEYERLFEYPFDFQEYVERRLREIDDLEERRFAKQLLQDGLLNIIRKSEERYRQLEQRVYHELKNHTLGYPVYMTICRKKEYDPNHPFLFSIRQDDCKPTALTTKNLSEAVSFYLDGTYAECQNLLKETAFFQGEIITSQGSFFGEFSVSRDERYMECIEQIYHLFSNNNIPWCTINCAYLMRFFQVNLQKTEAELPSNAEIQEVNIHFGELEPKIHYGFMPVWNIKTIPVKSGDFMVPCIDTVGWEHKISLKKLGLQNQYLIQVVKSVSGYRREAEELSIITTEQDLPPLTMCMIAKKGPTLPPNYIYPVLGNEKKDSFIKRLNENTAARLRTKAELFRLIHEMSTTDDIKYEGAEIIDGAPAKKIGYEMNPFIKDEIIDRAKRRVLLLKFRQIGNAPNFCEDFISFVVSDIQLTFDEYRCEGVLI